jgi:hypothetical protein
MSSMWDISILGLVIAGDALADCQSDLANRFSPSQAGVLCGKVAPDYSGTQWDGDRAQGGDTCSTKMGSCPLDISGAVGAPCECGFDSGRIPGFIQARDATTIRVVVLCNDCSTSGLPIIQTVGVQITSTANDSKPPAYYTLQRPPAENPYISITLQASPSRIRLIIPTADDAPPNNPYVAYDDKPEQTPFFTVQSGTSQSIKIYVRPDNFNTIRRMLRKIPRFVITKLEPG